MNNPQPEIDAQKVIDTIDENLKAISEGFDPKNITPEGAERIIRKIDEVEKLALAIKEKLNE